MPIFMVERNFAEELEPSLEAADGINRINDRGGRSLAVLVSVSGQAKDVLPL